MDCLFCRIAAGQEPSYVVLDEPDLVGFLDTRPVFKGHVLLLPRAHVDTLLELPGPMLAPLLAATQRVAAALGAALGAQGTFVAINNVVSQSVPHLHVHVVPRTQGDGLRGFFWPRTRYADEAEAADYATQIRAAVDPAAEKPV
ncbi:MAG TPA: HIT family protein [Nocardioidaceae bacterium]|nr:HIT family protein [Actinomycetota bacterium]MDQ3424389.1 HIT family protein [Actinomycetota bacterium]HEV8054985.1 HIT family protein [Nocardioidaceae bacterium]